MKQLLSAILVLCLLACVDSTARSAPRTVKLAKTHRVEKLPKFAHPFDYQDNNCVFVDKDTFACVRPLSAAQCGELVLCWPRTGKVRRKRIPQPSGFKPDYDFGTYFEDAGLWANGNGDLFVRWEIGGNGDHGLALLPRGGKDFAHSRSNLVLASSRGLAAPDGSWYFLRWNANVVQGYEREVYKVVLGKGMRFDSLGKHKGPGHHQGRTLDACFLSDDVIHLIWAEIIPAKGQQELGNHLRLVSADFNVQEKTWGPERTLLYQDRFTSWAYPAVITLADKSVHYFWTIWEGSGKATKFGGLFYQRGDQETAERLSASVDGFKAVAVGERITICYTLRDLPNVVCFRVIESGSAGPQTVVKVGENREHCLYGEYIVLSAAGEDRLWLVNTLDVKTFREVVLTAE